MNRNLEFKVFSGLEVIVKLEEALKSLDRTSGEADDPKLSGDSSTSKQGMDLIINVKKSAVNVENLRHEDFEKMNKKKIEML